MRPRGRPGSAARPAALAEAALLAAAAAMVLAALAAWALGADDPPWAAATLSAALLAYALVRRAWGRDQTPLLLPFPIALALLWAGAALSVTAAQRPTGNAVLALVASAAVVVIAFDLARRPGGAGRALAAAAAALAVGSAVAITAWLTGARALVPFTPDGEGRLAWPFTHPNYLGFFCAALLPLAVVAAASARRPLPRAAALLATALGLAALVLSGSRSAWIGAAVGVAVVAAYGPARRAIAAGTLVTLAAASPVILDRASDADAGLGNVRLQIWRDAIDAFADHPLTGVGINQFSRHARPLLEQGGAPLPGHAHELYLGRAAELGALGLAGIVALLVLALLAAHRGARRARGTRRLLGVGAAAALAALAVVGLLDDPFDDRAGQLVIWCLVGLAAAAGAAGAAWRRAGRPAGGAPRIPAVRTGPPGGGE